MHRPDTSLFLLFIEPPKEEKSETPLIDELTRIMRLALSEAKSGMSNYFEPNEEPEFYECAGYKGYHRSDCGERSKSCDYLLKNGMITNSLCVFYLQYYRNSIPASEMNKVTELVAFYQHLYHDTPEILQRDIPDEPEIIRFF
ncbi:MAG: hypothetical protein WCP32_18050 [Bacteroidota bacterium]